MSHMTAELSRAIGDLFLRNDDSSSLVLTSLGLEPSASSTSLHASLHTGSVPSSANEVGTGAYIDYRRVAVPRDSASWSSTAVGSDYYYYSNLAQIQFPAAGVGSSATIRSLALWDSVTGGRMLFGGAFTTSTLNQWKFGVTAGAVGGTTTSVKCVSHGLSVGDRFIADRAYDTVAGGPVTLPVYGNEYTVASVVDADEFTVADTLDTNVAFLWIKSFQTSGSVTSFITVTDGSVPTFGSGAVILHLT